MRIQCLLVCNVRSLFAATASHLCRRDEVTELKRLEILEMVGHGRLQLHITWKMWLALKMESGAAANANANVTMDALFFRPQTTAMKQFMRYRISLCEQSFRMWMNCVVNEWIQEDVVRSFHTGCLPWVFHHSCNWLSKSHVRLN